VLQANNAQKKIFTGGIVTSEEVYTHAFLSQASAQDGGRSSDEWRVGLVRLKLAGLLFLRIWRKRPRGDNMDRRDECGIVPPPGMGDVMRKT